MSALNELRLAGQLVDLVFVDAKGGKAMAHRVVVAGAYAHCIGEMRGVRVTRKLKYVSATSPYFSSAFKQALHVSHKDNTRE